MATPAGAVVPAAWGGPASPASPRQASRHRLVIAVMLVIAVGCAVAAIPVYRHGIAAHPFPSYVPGDPSYQVDRYSAPWIAGAIGLGGLAVILLIVSIGWLLPRRPAVEGGRGGY